MAGRRWESWFFPGNDASWDLLAVIAGVMNVAVSGCCAGQLAYADDGKPAVKPSPAALAHVKHPSPAAVDCPNGSCPVRVYLPRTTANTGMKPATATPQPVLYQSCPGGVCPTPQRRGLFYWVKGGR